MLRNSWEVAKPYFLGEKKYAALSMLLVIIAFELLYIYLNVQFNTWYNKFYNSLQETNYDAFKSAIKEWLVLVFCIIVVFIIKVFTNMWMQLHWRYWLTQNYLKKWTENRTFYGIKVMGYESDNPDQRIADDILSFVSYFMTLSIGLLSAVVSIVTFTIILWRISGDIDLKVLGHDIHVTGYMIWIALIYTVISTVMMHGIGKPLVKLLFEQERLQANFRYGMMRLREYAEAIAFYDASKFEHLGLLERFKEVVINTKQRIKLNLSLSLFVNIYSNIAIILPIIIVAPKYFAKAIKLGDVMQISSAFSKLNDSLSWIIDSYTSIAAFAAVSWRLHTFLEIMHQWQDEQAATKLKLIKEPTARLSWQNLKILLPTGQLLLDIKTPFNATANRYLIRGPSGAGKSTLLRTVAGLWPFTTGSINIASSVLFIPQSIYMPHGTLMHAIQYPQTSSPSKEKVVTLLVQAGLGYLTDRLDTVDEWGRVLSGGEKQRIALLRAILQQPRVLALDESFSALDQKNVKLIYGLMDQYLADTVILLVSHGYDETIGAWPQLIVEEHKVVLRAT